MKPFLALGRGRDDDDDDEVKAQYQPIAAAPARCSGPRASARARSS